MERQLAGSHCEVLLRLNGVTIRASDDELVDLVTGVAAGAKSKADVAVFLSLDPKRNERRSG